MSTARSEILARIRRATGGASTARQSEYEAIARNYEQASGEQASGEQASGEQASPRDPADVLELFVDLLHDYGAVVYRCDEHSIQHTVAQALDARGKRSSLVPRDFPRQWLPEGFEFLRETLDYAAIDASEGVLTDCALAIASTGTIVLRHGAGEARRALSLIPDYHLCIVFAAQVLGTVPEGIRQMRAFGDVPITTIAGPSATSDIEMTRIKGVHGPRTLDIILVG